MALSANPLTISIPPHRKGTLIGVTFNGTFQRVIITFQGVDTIVEGSGPNNRMKRIDTHKDVYTFKTQSTSQEMKLYFQYQNPAGIFYGVSPKYSGPLNEGSIGSHVVYSNYEAMFVINSLKEDEHYQSDDDNEDKRDDDEDGDSHIHRNGSSASRPGHHRP